MKKIGIIICGRYQDCGGGKCFRALRERVGGFSHYPSDEAVEIVGYSYCGGCPGGNIEYVPEEMKKNGAEVIHLATGLVVGYPPCPYLDYFVKLSKTWVKAAGKKEDTAILLTVIIVKINLQKAIIESIKEIYQNISLCFLLFLSFFLLAGSLFFLLQERVITILLT